MAENGLHVLHTDLEAAFWRLYRDYFDMAERRRRWRVADDIPWDRCNPKVNAAVVDVVESFCAVELYLPDYTSKILPVVRPSRGRTWFYANWGYEESKHSLALADWLLRSGARTESQMADLECNVFEREWNLPHDNHLGMLVYAMVQELATWLNYRNLRRHAVRPNGDPALDVLLRYVSVDERAHFDFFRRCVQLYLEHDREATVEQLRRVLSNFAMPAIYDLADSRRRIEQIRQLQIFDEEQYFREVYMPVLESLGVSRREIRDRVPVKKSAVDAAAP
jgi:acyl-[acyl-carrier-protein] desaturase